MTGEPASDPPLDALVHETIALCRWTCGPGEEQPLTDVLAEQHSGDPLVRVGHSLVVGAPVAGRPFVLLVGHIDVVPPTPDDAEPRRRATDDGDVLVGRGTSDMKGGVAVARACYRDAQSADWPNDVVLVMYAGEEGSAETNELGDVLEAVPWLHDASLAVVLEPTDLAVHLGCLGGLQAELTFVGRQAHSARPWEGDNAITRAADVIVELRDRPPRDVEVDGLVFRDVLVPTLAWTGGARNVVPGRFTVNVNFRFAPDRSLDDAEAELRAWVDDRAEITIVDRVPPAPPRRDAPAVRRFVDVVGAPLLPKQAWTDVARLTAAGVPALNYGPGVTAQAHQAGEHVPVVNLGIAYSALTRFLAEPSRD